MQHVKKWYLPTSLMAKRDTTLPTYKHVCDDSCNSGNQGCCPLSRIDSVHAMHGHESSVESLHSFSLDSRVTGDTTAASMPATPQSTATTMSRLSNMQSLEPAGDT
jgi:hypothetical protein